MATNLRLPDFVQRIPEENSSGNLSHIPLTNRILLELEVVQRVSPKNGFRKTNPVTRGD